MIIITNHLLRCLRLRVKGGFCYAVAVAVAVAGWGWHELFIYIFFLTSFMASQSIDDYCFIYMVED